jgi:DNA-directed RNA polymerase subunit H (RpoH/RPB5)
MTMYQNQSKQVVEVKLQYYETNKCEMTELILTINRATIIRKNKAGRNMLIDFAIPEHRVLIKKETENILKYTDLLKQIQRMWNMKGIVTPVIREATGTISKSLRQ